MGRFLHDWEPDIGEFWEPSYRHPSPAFFEMMRAIEDGDFAHAQPTSGFTRYLGLVRVTVLPGDLIAQPLRYLRHRHQRRIHISQDRLPTSRVEVNEGTRELHNTLCGS
jgi:hypothetical protein